MPISSSITRNPHSIIQHCYIFIQILTFMLVVYIKSKAFSITYSRGSAFQQKIGIFLWAQMISESQSKDTFCVQC